MAALTKLPEEVKAGDEIEVQLAPKGAYPQIVEGKEVTQIVDDAAINSLIENFNAEKAKDESYKVLVDADHSSEMPNADGQVVTKAMAWVDRVFADPDRGLVGVFVFTPEGAAAGQGKTYRFISPAWTLTEDGHPEKLVSVGMTNKPNLPVAPMLNMRAVVKSPAAGGAVSNADTGAVTQKKVEGETTAANDDAQGAPGKTEGNPGGDSINDNNTDKGILNMDIKAKLGLPEEATDEEVEQALDAILAKCEGMEAVQNALGLEPTTTNDEVVETLNAVIQNCGDLQTQNAEQEEARLNAEADQFVAENEDVIPEESVEEIKNEYVENPEAAQATVANMRRACERAVANAKKMGAKVERAVVNFHTAKKPVALNMESVLANCDGDPAKENEALRAMNRR